MPYIFSVYKNEGILYAALIECTHTHTHTHTYSVLQNIKIKGEGILSTLASPFFNSTFPFWVH